MGLLDAILGGVMGGLVGLSGLAPAVWTQLRDWPKDVARGVYQPFILVAHLAAVILIGAVALDRVGVVLFFLAAPAIALGGEMVDAFLLVPDGQGPFPAVVVVHTDAQTGIGLGATVRSPADRTELSRVRLPVIAVRIRT